MQTCSTDSKVPFFSSQVHSSRNNVWMVWPPSDETQSKLFPTCSYLHLIAVKTGKKKELVKLYLATWKYHRSNRFFHLMHLYVWMRTIFSFGFEAWEWAEHEKHVTAHETTSHQNDLHLDNGFRGLSEGIVNCARKNMSTQLPHL